MARPRGEMGKGARCIVVTILDVQGEKDAALHIARVRRWARSVWDAWAPHHETVRRWAPRLRA